MEGKTALVDDVPNVKYRPITKDNLVKGCNELDSCLFIMPLACAKSECYRIGQVHNKT